MSDISFRRIHGRIVPMRNNGNQKASIERKQTRILTTTAGAVAGMSAGLASVQASRNKIFSTYNKYAWAPMPKRMNQKFIDHVHALGRSGKTNVKTVMRGTGLAHGTWTVRRMKRANEWLGLATKHFRTISKAKYVGGMALGAAAGYGLGVLLTPRKKKK